MLEIGNRRGRQLSAARLYWKWYYRQLRIVRRESTQAWMDTLIFGTGYVRVTDDGFINHIRPEAIHYAPT